MVKAGALRVKYRKGSKQISFVRYLGVHAGNRGGVYPAGTRCRELCTEVINSGFVKEEVGHMCVAVEEVPASELIRSCGKMKKQSALEFNTEHAGKDPLLTGCFDAPYDDVRLSLLSHNHIMLVLRAFLTQAPWHIEANEEKDINWCDAKGCLSISAVAESKHGAELAELLSEGIRVEVIRGKWMWRNPTLQH